MELTFVQYWEEGIGWKNTTIDWATKNFPYTVSSSDKIFRCSLCRDYVTLTHSPRNLQKRHFRHERGDEQSYCEQRTEAIFREGRSAPWEAYSFGQYSPIVKMELKGDALIFKIGLRSLPQELRKRFGGAHMIVAPDRGSRREFKLSDRLQEKGTTYFPLAPAESYKLTFLGVKDGEEELSRFWSPDVPVITQKGICSCAFFDEKTGKLVPKDGDLVCDRLYCIVTTDPDFPWTYIGGSWDRRFYYSKTFYFKRFHIPYFTREYAKLIERLGYRLRRRPPLFIPVWPPYLAEGDRIVHNEEQSFIFVEGDAMFKSFPPNSKVRRLENPDVDDLPFRRPSAGTKFSLTWYDSSIIKVSGGDRRQLYAIGRDEILKQLYYCKGETTDLTRTELPVVAIQGERNEELTEETYRKKPSQIQFLAPYEGTVSIEEIKTGKVVDVLRLQANQKLPLVPKSGLKYVVYQGLDAVRSIAFEGYLPPPPRPRGISEDDALLRRKLDYFKDGFVPAPHSLGALFDRMNDYPLVKRWLFNAIRNNRAPRKALELIKKTFASRDL